MLSPTIAAAAATTITAAMSKCPRLASSAAVIRAVSPGTGTPDDSAMTRRNRSGSP